MPRINRAEELVAKCTKTQEAFTIIGDQESQCAAGAQFAKIGRAKAIPVHFIFGTYHDFV